MKIVNVMISKTLGGIEQAFLDYNDALTLSNHNILAIVSSKTKLNSQLKRQNVKTLHIPFCHFNYFLVFVLYFKLKKFSPDLIITHSKKSISILRIVAKLLHIPLVGVAHNPKLKHIDQCDYIFSITQYQKDLFVKKGYPVNRIFVIPNCIPEIPPYQQRFLHSPICFGTMGRFDPMKGFDTYLKALGILKQRGIQFSAVLGGAPENSYPNEEKKYLDLIKQHNLEDNVTLLGWIKNKEDFYNKIDVFVLPSKNEPFGIVLLEAMAHSVPIISSTAEGPLEIFNKNQSALLFTTGNELELAEQMQYMIEHPKELSAYAQKGWELCHNKYTQDTVSQTLNQAIEKGVLHG